MSWLFLALVAPALDTIVNFVDKYVIEHKLKDSHSMPIYSALAGLIFGTAVWLAFGAPTLSAKDGLIIFVSGMTYMGANALYFHALAKSQTSYIVALTQAIPVFILIMSYLLLDEPLSSLQLVGFVLVLSAVLGLSVDKTERRIKFTTTFYQIIGADILFALSAILIKFTSDVDSLIPILGYQSWGLAFGGLVLFLGFKRIRDAFILPLKNVGKSTMAILFVNESLANFSQSLTYLAITLGPVALIGVLGGTQVFYAILYGTALTLLWPRIFKEDTAKKDIAIKVAMSVVLFVGIWCIGSN